MNPAPVNLDITSLLQYVRASRRVLLTGPDSPDGDSIGACLALKRLLQRPGVAPGAEIVVTGRPGHRYGWMCGAAEMQGEAEIAAATAAGAGFDGVVVLDGDCRRLLPAVAAAFAGARWTAIIDHHRSTDPSLYTLAFFEPDAESTCTMIFRLFTGAGEPVDADDAALLYTGLIFDTGGFRYANTRASTHHLAATLLGTGIDHADIARRVLLERQPAALRLMGRVLVEAEFLCGGRLLIGQCPAALMQELGAQDEDIEGVVDMLQHTAGVQLAVLVIGRPGGRVRLSMRSPGVVDVAALAKSLSPAGGGHARAAGAQLTAPPEGAMAWLRPRLIGALDGPGASG